MPLLCGGLLTRLVPGWTWPWAGNPANPNPSCLTEMEGKDGERVQKGPRGKARKKNEERIETRWALGNPAKSTTCL